tara:strand:- start:6260 stop:6901 length:642 start_codon:yes stop_codon:yes gene_type:complete
MPQGPGTYGSQIGRPKLRRKKRSKIYERTFTLIERDERVRQAMSTAMSTKADFNPKVVKRDRSIIRAARAAAPYVKHAQTASKVLDYGTTIAGFATGGVGAGLKTLAKKAILQPAAEYVGQRVAGKVGGAYARELARHPVVRYGKYVRKAMKSGDSDEGQTSRPARVSRPRAAAPAHARPAGPRAVARTTSTQGKKKKKPGEEGRDPFARYGR